MIAIANPITPQANPRRPSLFATPRNSIGLAVGLVAGFAVGWVAFAIQQSGNLPGFFFPLLMPILVGAACGASAILVLRTIVTARAAIVAVSIVAAASAVLAQSWFGYRFYVSEIEGVLNRNPKAAMFRAAEAHLGPASFREFVEVRVRQAGAWWFADAALTVVASVIVAFAFVPSPKPVESQHV